MSLLKAYPLETDPARTLDLIKADFMSSVTAYMDEGDEGDLIAEIIQYYTEYSILYLHHVATTLETPLGATDYMKFMNSYIVTILHEAELHYYNKAQGFSVIDKTVQQSLDNLTLVSVDEINIIMDEIEESYVEEEEEGFDEDMASESVDEK